MPDFHWWAILALTCLYDMAISTLMQLHLALVGLSSYRSHFSGTMWCMSHPNLQSTQQEPKTVPSATTKQPRHIAIAAKEGKGAALRGTRHPLFAWCCLHLWRRGKPSMTWETWHLKITPWKRRFLFKTIIFGCYVSFRECNPLDHLFQPFIRRFFGTPPLRAQRRQRNHRPCPTHLGDTGIIPKYLKLSRWNQTP